VRHAEHQAPGALHEAVAALGFFVPVLVRQREVGFFVEQEGVFAALSAKM
jgi:hypothetical protein